MPSPLDTALAWLAGRRPEMEALLRGLVEKNSFTGSIARSLRSVIAAS